MARVWIPKAAPTLINPYRNDVLTLYRQLLHRCKDFNWDTKDGLPWKIVLWSSLKEEFTNGKVETDPHIIISMIAEARDYLMQIEEKWSKQHYDFIQHIEKTRNFTPDHSDTSHNSNRQHYREKISPN